MISGDTIESAKCILPLSENPTIDKRMGTRHLAALGLSEESDAVVVVVSEETGRIALAHEGVFQRGLEESALRGFLNKLLLPAA